MPRASSPPQFDPLDVVGRGVYSLSDASRLTGVSTQRLRRWFLGYRYRSRSGERQSPRVTTGDFADAFDRPQLSFLDVLEARVIASFRDAGVSWREIRQAHTSAAELLQDPHPFVTARFRTDGTKIIGSLRDRLGDEFWLELAEKQHVFRKVVEPFLKDLEFENGRPVRWRPAPRIQSVVVDPNRSFGQPIIEEVGIPTEALADYAGATSVDEAAAWYGVPSRAVRDAIRFETRAAA